MIQRKMRMSRVYCCVWASVGWGKEKQRNPNMGEQLPLLVDWIQWVWLRALYYSPTVVDICKNYKIMVSSMWYMLLKKPTTQKERKRKHCTLNSLRRHCIEVAEKKLILHGLFFLLYCFLKKNLTDIYLK